MNTNARTTSPDGSHWYKPDGTPCYEVPYADPRKGMRPTTLADARKLGLVPSVTTILRSLHKQALVDWLIEQSCLAVLTSPRNPGEELDAFVHRVLHVERVQDQEAEAAKDRGTVIHNAMEAAFSGQTPDAEIWPWIEKPFVDIGKRGKVIGTEVIVCGNGYGGKIDLVQETDHEVWIWDWKTSKKLPNPDKGGAWQEHKLQLAAYAAAWGKSTGEKPIRTGNIYISTVTQGEFCVCEHQEDWRETYALGFKPLVAVWQWLNSYRP